MIILSQVEPILEPMLENELWYLPTRDSTSARAASLTGLLELSPRSLSSFNYRSRIPPFEHNNRYLQFFGLPQFQPNEIEIKMNLDKRQILIIGRHERSDDFESEICEFRKRILIPNDVQMDQMKCFIANNGLLQIEAPINHSTMEQPQQIHSMEREIPIQFVNQPKATAVPNPVSVGSTEEKSISTEYIQGLSPDQSTKHEELTSNQLLSTERVIPIEFVGQQSTEREGCFVPKHREQLLQAAPPPNEERQLIREIPIRMARRPIDQGILCPCCNGRGSRTENVCSHSYYGSHSQNELQSKDKGSKKDHQPKNAQLLSSKPSTVTPLVPTSSVVAENLNKAINELEKVFKDLPQPSTTTNKSEEVIIEDIGIME